MKNTLPGVARHRINAEQALLGAQYHAERAFEILSIYAATRFELEEKEAWRALVLAFKAMRRNWAPLFRQPDNWGDDPEFETPSETKAPEPRP